MIETMSISEHTPPTGVAHHLLRDLLAQAEEMTLDQRLQLGQLAAQVAISDQLKSIDANLDTWTHAGLSVHTDGR